MRSVIQSPEGISLRYGLPLWSMESLRTIFFIGDCSIRSMALPDSTPCVQAP